MQKKLNENVKDNKYLCPEIKRLDCKELAGHHICSTYFTTNDGKPMIKLFLQSPTGVILNEDNIKIIAGSSVDLLCQDACDTEIRTGKLETKLKRSKSVENYEKDNNIDKNDEFIYSNYDNKYHRNLIYFCKKDGKKENKEIMKQLQTIFKNKFSDKKLEHNEFEVLPKDENKKEIPIKSAFINITSDPSYIIETKRDLEDVNISESYKNFLLVLTDNGFKVIDREKLNKADEYTKITKLCEEIDAVCDRLSHQPVMNNKEQINLNDSQEDEYDLDYK